MFSALQLKNKNPFFIFVASTSSALLWQGPTIKKKKNQGWDLCKFYSSAKSHQNNSPRGLTGEIGKKTTPLTFPKTWAPQNTSSNTQSEPESQPHINFSAEFISQVQTSVQQPLARTWSLNCRNGSLKLPGNKPGQHLIRLLNFMC